MDPPPFLGLFPPMQLSRRRLLLICAIAAASACLALGLSLPFVRVDAATVAPGLGAEPSLISAVSGLVRSGQLLLGAALLMLALLIPTLRLLYLVLLVAIPPKDIQRSADALRTLAWLGCWSPQDVLGVGMAAALVVTYDRAPHVAEGTWLLAAAMLVMTLATSFVRRGIGASQLRPSAEVMAQAASVRSRAFAALVAAATLALALGLLLPVTSLAGAASGAGQHSIISLAQALDAQGDIVLAGTIVALAALLPGLRILHLWVLVACRRLPAGALRTRTVALTRILGAFAIVDTLILALLLVHAMATGQAQAVLQPGAYALAASTGLTLCAHAWANCAPPRPRKLADRLGALQEAEAA